MLAVVFGSDHGLCGRFNREVVGFARQDVHRRRSSGAKVIYLAVGARAAGQLESAGERVEAVYALPGSADGLADMAHGLLVTIDRWREEHEGMEVLLFHNSRTEQAVAAPGGVQLLPLDERWLRRLAGRHWHSRAIPTFTLDVETLFSSLVRQHLFVGLFHAAAESAASEHTTRLAAMKAAERSIKEHLDDMNAAYRGRRQEAITAELLDVVAGFEALGGGA